MSYEALLAIYTEAAERAAEHRSAEPTQCPNDGTVLTKNNEGVLHCRFDGWTNR